MIAASLKAVKGQSHDGIDKDACEYVLASPNVMPILGQYISLYQPLRLDALCPLLPVVRKYMLYTRKKSARSVALP